LLNALLSERVGCHIDGRVINVLAYADDLVLLAPSWYAMQHLLDVLETQSHVINMSCYVQKTVCMVVRPKRHDKIVASEFPLLSIGVNSIQFVSEFKYSLGHVINSCMSDDDDINREVRNMFTRTNLLIRLFGNCSVSVKMSLFRTYCLNLYDTGLWHTYLKGVLKCFWI